MTDFGAVWLNAMFQGDLESAWLASDRILANPIAPDEHRKPRHLQRIWNGQALENKRVLVRCYHGLGDTIQFARFLPGLVGHAASVMTWIQPELLTLMRMQSGFGEFLPLHDGTPDVEYDVDIEIMELAHALRATNEMISASVPYLRVNEICDELRRHNGDNGEARTPKVGIAWRAGGASVGPVARQCRLAVGKARPNTVVPIHASHSTEVRRGLDRSPPHSCAPPDA